jgi:flagellar motor switch protein FliN/FliY
MADIQQLTDAMLAAAAGVLGRLVDEPVAASAASRNDHQGSIRVDGSELVTIAKVPSLGISVVVRFSKGDVSKIVTMMLGGDDSSEMGAMQLSIVSETVSQTAAAMAEELAKGMGASGDGIHADLCSDATNLPPPPFVSYEGQIQVGADLAPAIAMDFDGIAYSKIAGAAETESAPAVEPAVQTKAAPVSFTSMNPTPARAAHAAGNLDLVHDVPLQIRAVLGKTALPLRDVVTLQSGSVFELDKLSSDPIDLYVNNILIARGEVVVVDDKFAVKISELNPSVD